MLFFNVCISLFINVMIWLITFTWAGIFQVTISDSYLLQYSGKTVGLLANLLPIVVTCPNHGSSPYTSKILLRISGDMPSRDWWTSILWKINISTSGPLIAVTRKVHAMAMIICDTFLTHLLGNKLRPSYQFAMQWFGILIILLLVVTLCLLYFLQWKEPE